MNLKSLMNAASIRNNIKTLREAQTKLAATVVHATVPGVTMSVDCAHNLKSIAISPTLMATQDPHAVEAAIRDCIEQVNAKVETESKKMLGPLAGLFSA